MNDDANDDQEQPEPSTQPAPRPRRARGFAALDRARVSEIARLGGRAAHARGTAHEFTPEEARAAGRKGGIAPHVRRGPKPKERAPS